MHLGFFFFSIAVLLLVIVLLESIYVCGDWAGMGRGFFKEWMFWVYIIANQDIGRLKACREK